LVFTITMWNVFPDTPEPAFVAVEVTTTCMYAGRGPDGAGALFPGGVLHPVPQLGVVGLFANPWNDDGAGPPLSVLPFDHCGLQNVTEVPEALLPSPITKLPPPGAKGGSPVGWKKQGLIFSTRSVCVT
jgi:hypothetical protein